MAEHGKVVFPSSYGLNGTEGAQGLENRRRGGCKLMNYPGVTGVKGSIKRLIDRKRGALTGRVVDVEFCAGCCKKRLRRLVRWTAFLAKPIPS